MMRRATGRQLEIGANMKKLSEWRSERDLSAKMPISLTREQLAEVCHDYFRASICGNMRTIQEFRDGSIVESSQNSRYSVEVNFRTKSSEAMEGFAKICLGYISAAMKRHGFHTKHVFTEKPLRLLVTSRNWDDGTWTGCVTWNPDHNCFILSRGFYNKDRKTVSVQKSDKCKGSSASELSHELVNVMHGLRDKPDRHEEKLKPVPLKRGPKR